MLGRVKPNSVLLPNGMFHYQSLVQHLFSLFFSYIPLPQGPILAVSLDVSHKGLGITIAGGIGNEHIPGDHSIFITSVFPNGSAYSLLEAGMKVIEIDGANVENELHEKVVEKLNNAGARINLLVGCPARNSSGVGNFYHRYTVLDQILYLDIQHFRSILC